MPGVTDLLPRDHLAATRWVGGPGMPPPCQSIMAAGCLAFVQTFHVPMPPLNYLPRPDQLEPLVVLMLSKRTEAVGVVGMQGMGGIGKSVLAAAAAASDIRVR